VLCHGSDTDYLLVYVDDIVLTASSTSLLRTITKHLHRAFAMKDLGSLHFFLWIQVLRSLAGLFLSQENYAEDLLDRAGMHNCRHVTTPIDTKSKTYTSTGTLVDDATKNRILLELFSTLL
jgi:hypothetical protein